MGLTVIVNMLTVAHKGSNGMLISFPDVCKTPTPAGPVPIPYPNIAKSSDVVSGSSTVKMDGGMIMNKGSNTMMSTGDEAGAAMGVVSNRIKGKAEFVNYSFDVKVDGKNVCRLTDPAQSNMGSGNSIAPACVQAPLFAMTPQLKACEKTKKKEESDKDKKGKQKKTNWSDSYVHDPHKRAFETVATRHGLLIFIRRNNKYVLLNRWIPDGHMPKPHSVIHHGTMKPEKDAVVKMFKDWLKEYHDTGREEFQSVGKAIKYKKFQLVYPRLPRMEDAKSFFGVVVDSETGEPYKGYGKYKSKWMTGDYDLMDVVKHDDPHCGRLAEDAYRNLMHELNKEMGWDGIQHGPQAYWTPNPRDRKKGAAAFSIPAMLKKYLSLRATGKSALEATQIMSPESAKKYLDALKKGKNPPPPSPIVTVAEKPHREFAILDTELNVVAPNGHVVKLDGDEAADALICCGCYKKEATKLDGTLEKEPAIPLGEG